VADGVALGTRADLEAATNFQGSIGSTKEERAWASVGRAEARRIGEVER